MSRPTRIEFEGAWYHVMNRGAGRRDVFTTDSQREYFLSLLSVVSERFNAEIHAYCLMSNHYHLLIRTPNGNLQRIMRHINGVYTQYYNRSEGVDGALFRGRYKAVLVDAQNYWQHLSRYIHRNPIDAGMVESLSDYPWSSYPAYIGIAKAPDWLAVKYILNAFGHRQRQRRYQQFVEGESDDMVYQFYAKKKIDSIMGGDDFIQQQLRQHEPTVDTPDLKRLYKAPDANHALAIVAKQFDIELKDLMVSRRGRAVRSPARAMGMLVLHDLCEYTLSDVAEYFDLKDYSSVSSVIRSLRIRMEEEEGLRLIYNTIKLDLTPCISHLDF